MHRVMSRGCCPRPGMVGAERCSLLKLS